MSTINGRIQSKRDTTARWNAARGMIPLEGEIIIYTDYKEITKEIDGEIRNILIPGIKIGDGRAYVQDLPFIDEELRDRIMAHINNNDIHVTVMDKLKWDNKLNVNDNQEIVNGALILNRN